MAKAEPGHADRKYPQVDVMRELRDNGVLWAMNRLIFHPRGFCLQLVVDSITGSVDNWQLVGDGSQPWSFADDELDHEAFRALEALLDAHRTKSEPEVDEKILHSAWLLWCFDQGYVTPQDREGMTNWMLPDFTGYLSPDSLTEKARYIEKAKVVRAELLQVLD